MSLYLLNIGNTRVQQGIWQDGRVVGLSSVLREKFDSSSMPRDIPIAGVSVVPETQKALAGMDIFWLKPTTKLGLDMTIIDNSTIGMDRLANAVALANFAKLPAVCIDCGTAITFDVLDHHSLYRGGAIAPGRWLMRKILHEKTAQLPLLDMETDSATAIGRDTYAAMRSGIDLGSLGMVREILRRIYLELGVETCQTIATGGDAGYFVQNILELDYGGADFTLRGLARAWEMNHEG